MLRSRLRFGDLAVFVLEHLNFCANECSVQIALGACGLSAHSALEVSSSEDYPVNELLWLFSEHFSLDSIQWILNSKK